MVSESNAVSEFCRYSMVRESNTVSLLIYAKEMIFHFILLGRALR